MSVSKSVSQIKYDKIKAFKMHMSQMFDENAKLVPFTNLKVDIVDLEKFKELKERDELKILGFSKGRGFAGTVKRWGFRAGPKTHGQLFPRKTGSIGAQGQGRVIPGKKMPGRMGNEAKTIVGKYLGLDESLGAVKFKGAVPGGKNSKVYIYLKTKSEN
jgi:ribosomal protein L3